MLLDGTQVPCIFIIVILLWKLYPHYLLMFCSNLRLKGNPKIKVKRRKSQFMQYRNNNSQLSRSTKNRRKKEENHDLISEEKKQQQLSRQHTPQKGIVYMRMNLLISLLPLHYPIIATKITGNNAQIPLQHHVYQKNYLPHRASLLHQPHEIP